MWDNSQGLFFNFLLSFSGVTTSSLLFYFFMPSNPSDYLFLVFKEARQSSSLKGTMSQKLRDNYFKMHGDLKTSILATPKLDFAGFKNLIFQVAT